MSNVSHEVGATIKNLAVTGVTVDLPYPDDLWLNYQIDAGITRASGEITAWQSQGTNNMSLTNVSPYAPTDDGTIKLAGINTVKFNSANTEYLEKINTSVMKLVGQKVITLLIRAGANQHATQKWLSHPGYTDGHYEDVFSISNPNSGTTLRLYWYNRNYVPTTVDVTMNSIVGEWSAISIKFNSQHEDAKPVIVWQDGVKIYEADHECEIANWLAAPYRWRMGVQSDINIAALLWWNRDMTDDELIASQTWLKLKYGVS